ncbi:Uncharacterised protein [Aquipseudomonas alcaligenes]|nr:Uncharacterised protein [Pseudomonas alcaligenes]
MNFPSFPIACARPLWWGRRGYPVLAFWALWHCRHARPPDASFAA